MPELVSPVFVAALVDAVDRVHSVIVLTCTRMHTYQTNISAIIKVVLYVLKRTYWLRCLLQYPDYLFPRNAVQGAARRRRELSLRGL